jgi:hypothetical protein
MKRPTAFPFTYLLAPAILIAGGAAPLAAQQHIDERAAVAPDAYIRVYDEAAGSVRVTGWDRDSVAVSGTRDSGAGRFSFSGGGDAAKMGLWTDGDSAGEAHLDVRVPAGATVWVKTTSALVEIGDVASGVDAYSVTGDIRVSGTPRQVYAESMGGSVQIVGTALSARGKTGSSPITFRGDAEDVSFTTVGGTIMVMGPRLRLGHFESVTGDILFEGEIEKGSSLGFQTHSGTIELRLPSDVGADVTYTTIEGDLQSDFPLGEADDRGGMRGRERQFSLGNSGATVTIRSFSGEVLIRRK